MIITEAIHDRGGMEPYSQVSGASLGEHGATVLVVDENVEVLEGEWHGNRTVILEYESVEKARQWYESASYQAAADCNVVIASGFVPRAAETA